jgi:hypothetical protein
MDPLACGKHPCNIYVCRFTNFMNGPDDIRINFLQQTSTLLAVDLTYGADANVELKP